MKTIKNLLSLSILLVSLNGLASTVQPLTCYDQSGLDSFAANWKIVSTINFGFGQVFCKVAYSDETDACAASYALDGRIGEFLARYAEGSKICGEQMIKTCHDWCGLYISELECTKKCTLKNYKTLD